MRQTTQSLLCSVLVAVLPLAAMACTPAPLPAKDASVDTDPASWVTTSQSAPGADLVLQPPSDRRFAGDLVREDSDLVSDMRMTYRSAERQWEAARNTHKHVQKRVAILDVRGGSVARLQVTYQTFLDEVNGAPRAASGLVVGKAYLVDLTTQPTSVTDAEGRAVTAAERQAVLKEELSKKKAPKKEVPEREIGREPSAAPVARATRVGEDVPAYARYLENEMSSMDVGDVEVHVKSARLVAVREVRGEPCGVIGVDIGMKMLLPNGIQSVWRLQGSSLLRASDGATVDTALSGPVHMEGQLQEHGQAISMVGNGSLRLRVRALVERHPTPSGV